MSTKTEDNNEEIFATGKLFELVHLKQDDGRIFEVARRAPGVRVIIANKNNRQVLLTKEFRSELNAWDYRLPGGKVFDSLEDYQAHRISGNDILLAAKYKAKAEAAEEAGIEVDELKLVKVSTLGATVEWDLYVFEAIGWKLSPSGQKLEYGEQIDAGNWIAFDKAKQMILSGEIQEDRIALILLQWLYQQTGEST